MGRLDLLDSRARAGDVRALLATIERLTREHAAPPADGFADMPAAAVTPLPTMRRRP
jgi:hypothetical protein